jgi:hypothetical protein
MELMTPSDRKVFEWRTDKNQLPVEASFGVPHVTPSATSSNTSSTAAGAGSSDGKNDPKSTDNKSPVKTDDSSSTQAEAKTSKDGK